MAAVTVKVQGTVLAGPPQVGLSPSAGLGQVNLAELMQLTQRNDGVHTAVPANATDVEIPFGAVDDARFVYVKSTAKIVLKVTSSQGMAQKLPASGTFLIVTPDDDPITAIVYDTGNASPDVEYLIAGDAA